MIPSSAVVSVSDPASGSQYAQLPARMRSRIPAEEWALQQPLIDEIRSLKKFRRAVVLAHNYQAPEIYYGCLLYTSDAADE